MQTTNKTPVIIGIIVIALVLVIVITQFKGKENKPAGDNTQSDSSIPLRNDTATSSLYTMTEVASHSSVTSCWAVVNGNVYDLTSWISQHPGGEQAILGLCGKDGTSAFEKQHGGQEGPENALAGFQIGSLIQPQ